MAIVFVNRYFYPDYSATSQLLTDLCFDLARRGESVTVISSRQIIDDATACLPSRETIQGVRVYRVWSPHFGRQRLWGRSLDYLGFYFSAAYRAWAVLSGGDTLVAKTDPPMLSVVLGQIAKFRNARLLNWLQDLFPEVAVALRIRGISGPVAGGLKALRNRSLRQAEMNVVLSTSMADRLRSEGLDTRRISVIHNWADGRQLQPLPVSENPLRRQWGLEHCFVVEYSGNMGRAHDFETLLNAAAVLSGHPRIRFLFIGGGAMRAAVEAGARRRHLDNILFKPYQERQQLGLSLAVGDVHLVSLHPELEGLIVPSKFYGIAAAGRACIYLGDSQGEIGRVINASGCGTCVPVGDFEGLAESILALAADREMCLEQGRCARKVFDDCFDRPMALHKWMRVLGL